MMRRDRRDDDLTAALDAFRASAHAEADARFDERTLEAQRHQILARIEHAGQPARVLHFPAAGQPALSKGGVSRRWISVAAAAGLIVGILAGQWLHVLPIGTARRVPSASSAPSTPQPGRPVVLPAISGTPDDDLLDAVDTAVRLRSISELRALDDLTFSYEPR
jgi:hypothetical protein